MADITLLVKWWPFKNQCYGPFTQNMSLCKKNPAIQYRGVEQKTGLETSVTFKGAELFLECIFIYIDFLYEH